LSWDIPLLVNLNASSRDYAWQTAARTSRIPVPCLSGCVAKHVTDAVARHGPACRHRHRCDLDAAEPILRGARAKAYLERLDESRARLATR
jgi:hypothetical protein